MLFLGYVREYHEVKGVSSGMSLLFAARVAGVIKDVIHTVSIECCSCAFETTGLAGIFLGVRAIGVLLRHAGFWTIIM